MTATVSLEPFAKTTLAPGHYWIEIATERPLAKAALSEALASMGMERVRFEHKDPSYVPSSNGYGYGHTPATFGLRGPEPLGSTTSIPIRTTSQITAATTLQPTITEAQAKAVAQVAAAVLAPVATSPISSAKLSPEAAALLQKPPSTMSPEASALLQKSPAPAPGGYAVAPKPSTSPYDVSAPAPSRPAPAPSTYAAFDPTAAGHDYVPPRNLPMEEEAGSPAPLPAADGMWKPESVAAVAAPFTPKGISVGPGCTLLNPGSRTPMYLCPPQRSGMSVGAASPAPTTRVCRFTAFLPRPMTVTSASDLRFQAVHRLAFDPSASLTDEPRGPRLRMQPFPLVTGGVYDLRFLSRDKTARSKEAVKALLDKMGFAPAEVMLMARNLRVPGRPATSLSEWLGVGTWRAPASLVTSDDPFYFAEARPAP